jgi:hypothetical protein
MKKRERGNEENGAFSAWQFDLFSQKKKEFFSDKS